jgi:hypothetical protein
MLKMKFIKEYGSYFVFAAILGVFVSGFLILNRIYVSNAGRPKTIVLESSYFNADAYKNNTMKPKNVSKFDTDSSVFSSAVLDDNLIIYGTIKKEGKYDKNKICILDFNNKSIQEADDTGSFNFIPLSGRNQVMYSSAQKKEEYITTLFDLDSQKPVKILDGLAEQIYKNDTMLGMTKDSLFIQDLNTDKRKIILTVSDFNYISGSISGQTQNMISKSLFSKKIWLFSFSHDGSVVYFEGLFNGNPALYSVDIKNNGYLELLLKGAYNRIIPLSNGDLLLCGKTDTQEGIFLYSKDKPLKVLTNGEISNMDMTPDGKLSYIIKNTTNISELHCALLENDTLKHDRMLYSDIGFVSMLKWTPNSSMLYCISDLIDQSRIYRFSF